MGVCNCLIPQTWVGVRCLRDDGVVYMYLPELGYFRRRCGVICQGFLVCVFTSVSIRYHGGFIPVFGFTFELAYMTITWELWITLSISTSVDYLSHFWSPMCRSDLTTIECISKASSRAGLIAWSYDMLFVTRVKVKVNTRELLHTRLCTDEMYHAKLL